MTIAKIERTNIEVGDLVVLDINGHAQRYVNGDTRTQLGYVVSVGRESGGHPQVVVQQASGLRMALRVAPASERAPASEVLKGWKGMPVAKIAPLARLLGPVEDRENGKVILAEGEFGVVLSVSSLANVTKDSTKYALRIRRERDDFYARLTVVGSAHLRVVTDDALAERSLEQGEREPGPPFMKDGERDYPAVKKAIDEMLKQGQIDSAGADKLYAKLSRVQGLDSMINALTPGTKTSL